MKAYTQEKIILGDGYTSHAALFTPPADALAEGRRPVLYLHGIQSHGGWFANSATVLAGVGTAVLLPDRRGSGGNGPDRGHARGVGQLLDDGRRYLERAAELGDGGPVHLLGVSWGGKWATALAAEFPDRVASLVLSTPGLYARQTLSPLARVGVALCSLLAPRKKFTIPLNEPELFTDVPYHLKFIAEDALRLRKATARFLLASHLMERRLDDWAAAVRCPTLLLLADDDPIIDNARTLALLQRRIPTDRLTVKRFASAVHTLEFTSDPSDYFQTLIDWIHARD